jgi:hypothetical protein
MFQCEHTQNECVHTQRPSECEHTRFECVHTRWAPGKATVDHVYQSANSESTCYLTKVIGECATLTHSLNNLIEAVHRYRNVHRFITTLSYLCYYSMMYTLNLLVQ